MPVTVAPAMPGPATRGAGPPIQVPLPIPAQEIPLSRVWRRRGGAAKSGQLPRAGRHSGVDAATAGGSLEGFAGYG